MSAKKNFVLRLNEETYQLLEKWADDEFRSVNGQLEWIIHEALKKANRLKKHPPRKNINNICDDE